jgi:hypothetical protein
MSEKRAYTLLKRHLVAGKPRRRLDRVENIISSGWPDCNGCFNGAEFWIEIKEPKEPKRATTPLFGSNHNLSLEQRNWIKRQLLAGGLAYIYIDTGNWRLLMGGSSADEINSLTLNQLKDSALWFSKVPVRTDSCWEKIAEIIFECKT